MIIVYFIPLFFGLIHFIEFISIISRYAGVNSGNKALAFSMQRAVTMLTRLFTMLMLPALGFLIDSNINKEVYIYMVSASFFCATILCLLVLFLFKSWQVTFEEIIELYKRKNKLALQLFKLPYLFVRNVINNSLPISNSIVSEKIDNTSYKIFFYSIVIYFIYSSSVFISFYLALSFPEHKTMLSHLSGISNMFAAVLLTFIIEPKIAVRIDNRPEKALHDTKMLLHGRLIGSGVLTQILIILILIHEIH